MEGKRKKQRQAKEKSALSIRAFYIIVIVIEILVVVAGSSGILELIHGSFDSSRGVPDVVWLVAISVILGGGTTLFLVRFFSAPVRILQSAMHKVAEGDFDVRLNTGRGFKEIRQISESFNMMTEELGATEILQTDFVSNVSHEFKTPINAIEGYATLLQDSRSPVSEEQAAYIEKILLNTRRLSHLVGNILLLSKVDNKVIPEKDTRYRLDEQIRESILHLEPRWMERDTEFDVELEEMEYVGNKALLFHVWNNLIENAIKFGPRAGLVTLRLSRIEDGVRFTVSDEGPGIGEAAQKHIFDRFYQTDSSHKAEGNGLGLALVKQILSAVGGQISVENLPERGVKFTVTLPSEDRDAAAED